MRNVLQAALIAGILAGLAAAAFHFLATESIIDAAIALEGTHDEEPIVTREVQKLGLFIGFAIYGLTLSLLFGAIFHLAHEKLPGSTTLRRSLTLAAAAFWSVALLPTLKYPANPPGVGDPETIATRQTMYLACLVLSVLATVAALAVQRRTHSWPIALATLAVASVAIFVVLPPNTDAIAVPQDLLVSFRALSLVGLAIFWAVLGLTFGVLLQRSTTAPALRTHAAVP